MKNLIVSLDDDGFEQPFLQQYLCNEGDRLEMTLYLCGEGLMLHVAGESFHIEDGVGLKLEHLSQGG